MNPRAALFMILSALGFTLMYVFIEELSAYGSYQKMFFRGLGTFVIAAGYVLASGESLIGNRPPLLLARALTGAASLLLFFLSINYVPITLAVVVRYLSPIIAIVFAMIFLRERIRLVQWLFFVAAFAGVVLLRGVETSLNGLGLLFCLASAFFGGLTLFLVRAIGKTENPLVIISYFTGTAMLVGLGGLLFGVETWQPPSGKDYLMFIGLGVAGFIGQIFMTIAVQIEEANRVMPLKYSEAVMLMLVTYLFYDQAYTPWMLVGIALIILGNVANTLIRKPAASKAATDAG